jgi:hypothetical protein
MTPVSRDHDELIEHALAAVQAAAVHISRRKNLMAERTEFVPRVANLEAQHKRFRRLDEYCNEVVAKTRASLVTSARLKPTVHPRCKSRPTWRPNCRASPLIRSERKTSHLELKFVSL